MKIKTNRYRHLALTSLAILGSGLSLFAQHDPTPEFKGTIGTYLKDTKESWPERKKAPEGAPNVVWILIDDIGYGAIKPFGGLIETPTLDKLAQGGLKYTNFHTTAICSPTRAALLTGRNSHAAHVGMHTELGIGTPGYDGFMPLEKATVADILRENGYNTFAVGKWHLTSPTDITPAGPFNRWPTSRGFDQYYGFLPGATDQYHPLLWENTRKLEEDQQGKMLTTLLTDKSIQYIAEQKSADPNKPFFLYYAPGAGHAPHQVAKEWSDKYKGKFDIGWDKYREVVLQNQIKAGVIPAGTVLPPSNPGIKAWSSLSVEEQKLYARFMEVYAGFISHTDYEIGRLVNYLESINQLDNTLIFVAVGDNGASQEGTYVGTIRHGDHNESDEERLKRNLKDIDLIGTEFADANYPLGWSMAANTPFRYYKRYANSEGGTHNPLIVHYPKGIQEKGGIRNQYSHVTDILPTTLELTGAKVPEFINGYKQDSIQGTSLAFSINDKKASSRHNLQYYEISGTRSIYKDGWKASVLHTIGTDFSEDKWELYHLAEDINERFNLADKNPTKLKELQKVFDEEAKKYNVYPLHERLTFSTRSSYENKNEIVFYPGISSVTHGPRFNGKTYTITANVAISNNGAEGVLIAQGGQGGGFSFYLKEKKLYFTLNGGANVIEINSETETIPTGNVSLKVEHAFDKENGSVLSLFINDKKVKEQNIGKLKSAPSYEALEIGRDISTPVSKNYTTPYAFTGTLKTVTVNFK